MKIRCVWEHNGGDTMLYAVDFVGAFARGASLGEAAAKMPGEVARYCRWAGELGSEHLRRRPSETATQMGAGAGVGCSAACAAGGEHAHESALCDAAAVDAGAGACEERAHRFGDVRAGSEDAARLLPSAKEGCGRTVEPQREMPAGISRASVCPERSEGKREDAASRNIVYSMFRRGAAATSELGEVEVVQDYECGLDVRDADSDVLFDAEREPLTRGEYEVLKALALNSARDFLQLYSSISDKKLPLVPDRPTFYDKVPQSAEEMYEHTKCVNSYYFGEVGVEADCEGDIFECRLRGFELLEKVPNFLENRVFDGSYGEFWSVRKVLRRFIWHDRIHAKAMWRNGVKKFGELPNVFNF